MSCPAFYGHRSIAANSAGAKSHAARLDFNLRRSHKMTHILFNLRKLLFPILVIGTLVCLTPSPTQAKDTWISVRTKNFTLVGNASEKEIRQVATRLEQFRDVLRRLLKGAKFETPVPTTVIVFKSMSSYKPFNIGNNAGYFQKGDDVNYITLSTELGGQNPYSIIYHEFVHLLVDNNLGNVPPWFNEGLAEYYSTFDIEEDRKVHLGELIPYHLQTLREDKLLPLRTLFAVDHYSPYYNEGSKRGVFYAESWALVHYLILSNNGQHFAQLSQFLNLTDEGVALDQAFKQSFQMEIEALEKLLILPMPTPKLPAGPERFRTMSYLLFGPRKTRKICAQRSTVTP